MCLLHSSLPVNYKDFKVGFRCLKEGALDSMLEENKEFSASSMVDDVKALDASPS